ncbi:hypothetical protein BpHYR1_005142 [Brachionus plicatilis]|uniref:Uncharacterized protein n=1 Tax=Brachionus plicatilis TaxID=10195 RepID=A0A3M7SNT9_BRAPC|nr:hypothetical protein BpHYR1_005142 [Brachionus plicatilis]
MDFQSIHTLKFCQQNFLLSKYRNGQPSSKLENIVESFKLKASHMSIFYQIWLNVISKLMNIYLTEFSDSKLQKYFIKSI